MQDLIIKEIVVKANKEKVFSAITDPKQIISWFPDSVEEGSLEVGQQPILSFMDGKHKSRIFVEKVIPFEYFSYRWVPGSKGTLGDVLKEPNTLVEFFIEEMGENTKVTVKESGFSLLPTEWAEESFKQNSGGWEFMVNRLAEFINK